MPTTTNAANLLTDLLAEGFRQGPPPHLHVDMLLADIDSYALLECEACGHGAQRVTPYHRGREYRLVCLCRRCGHPQEM